MKKNRSKTRHDHLLDLETYRKAKCFQEFLEAEYTLMIAGDLEKAQILYNKLLSETACFKNTFYWIACLRLRELELKVYTPENFESVTAQLCKREAFEKNFPHSLELLKKAYGDPNNPLRLYHGYHLAKVYAGYPHRDFRELSEMKKILITLAKEDPYLRPLAYEALGELYMGLYGKQNSFQPNYSLACMYFEKAISLEKDFIAEVRLAEMVLRNLIPEKAELTLAWALDVLIRNKMWGLLADYYRGSYITSVKNPFYALSYGRSTLMSPYSWRLKDII